MTRTWFGVIAVGVLAAACAEPNPPPPPAPTATVGQPAADADASSGPIGGTIGGTIGGNMPPSAMNANPPGTPAYVIAPGDPVGRPIPRPGGGPAF